MQVINCASHLRILDLNFIVLSINSLKNLLLKDLYTSSLGKCLLRFRIGRNMKHTIFSFKIDSDSAYNTFKFFKSRYETMSFALDNRILVVISLVHKYLSLFASLSLLLFKFNVLLVTAATNDDITHILTYFFTFNSRQKRNIYCLLLND